MNTNFKRNLFLGFGMSFLIVLISSVGSFISIRKLLESNAEVTHTQEILDHLDNSMSGMIATQNGLRGYLLTGDQTHIQENLHVENAVSQNFDAIYKLTLDNPVQQQTMKEILPLRIKFFEYVKSKIRDRENNTAASTDISSGISLIEEIQVKVDRMAAVERDLYKERFKTAKDYGDYTTWLIVIAALLSIGTSVAFFLRILEDYNERVRLNDELHEKDLQISTRIEAISSIAAQISAGNYKVRVAESNSDALGVVGDSLNQMAIHLDQSFTELSEKEWIGTSRVGLAQVMMGDKEVKTLATDILSYLVQITDSQAAVLYLEDSKMLRYTAGYAVNENHIAPFVPFGQGLVGQVMVDGQMREIRNENPDNLLISFATGEVKPSHILAFPLNDLGSVGVIELATSTQFTNLHKEFLQAVSFSIATSIMSAQSRARIQELLEETQSQAEELKAQHTELESMNVELEAQAEKLQASEEELRVQQEELQHANQELMERSALLEERNKEIVQKSEDLERSTRYKSEFLANMSHELRTPLNSILLLSRLLSENTTENMTEEQVEFARVILSSGNGLLGLIDEILDLSKIEAGKMEMEFLEVPTSEITQELHNLFNHVAKEKGLEFKIDTTDAPLVIRTDKMRLEQVLKNLISNAIKFTNTGYVSLAIARHPESKNQVLFTVKDTGIGIAKEKQAMVFDAFQQADGSTKRKYGGTGLGLSISRELVRLLNGEIRLQSEIGKGSEFTVEIPISSYKSELSRNAEEVVHPQFETNLPTTEVKEPKPSDDKKSEYYYVSDNLPEDLDDDSGTIQDNDKVILIVEDDVNFAKVLLDFTRKRGYKGVTTVRGDYALGLAVQYKPVGILLDVQLPKKSGWQVLEELKENPLTKAIPVHMMSSHKLKHQSLLKGAVNFLDKPVAFEQIPEIFKRIEEVVQKKSRKVLILEENPMHAQALSYFLETHQISSEIRSQGHQQMESLPTDVDCVIMDMGIPDKKSYETLEKIKEHESLKHLPIIVFTGKSLSLQEEVRIKKYADSIIVKTAHSYQRMLDEVSLFLHLVEEGGNLHLKQRRQQSRNGLTNILENKTALIVDDDVRNIYSLTKALESHKMKVITAIDGNEALLELDKHPDIDVVLLDMMMPNMDGYETAQTIRKNSKWTKLPVIAVTAKAMVGDREKCINAGASDYITKPVDTDQLLSLLRVWLYQKN